MSLGADLERNITDAWLKLRDKILSNPHDLAKRLARRRSPSLTRPPRAWCIAIRASDRRITPAHWVISPEHAMDLNHPAHPYEPIEHEVTIRHHAIRRYCTPVCFSREDAVDVAKMLGISSAMLLYARRRGRFYTTYLRGLGGKRGRAIPLLDGGRQLLDPGHHSFERPHPIWGSMWEWLSREFPRDFEQTIIRRPRFGRAFKWSRHPDDSPQLLGYRWLCPKCNKPAATIYYPLPVRTLFETGDFDDPVIELKLPETELPKAPESNFACMRCHRINYFSSISADAWNQAVSYLSAGMLYGREVEKPASFIPQRKKVRTRQLNREAPEREKVFDGLRKGWSNVDIARELGKTRQAVNLAISKICKQERVKDVPALAKKLQFPVAPPLNCWQRAAARRPAILEMMLGDCTHAEMVKALNIEGRTLRRDIRAIYLKYNLGDKRHGRRRALAEKLGVPFVERRRVLPRRPDPIRDRVAELREMGIKWKEIARELGVSEKKVDSCRVMLSRAKKDAGRICSAIPTPGQRPSIAAVELS